MKSLWIAIGTLLAVNAFADERVIVTCGDYKITYDGERSGWFAGVNVKQSQFSLHLPDGSSLFTRWELNSEGGELSAESFTYDSQTGEVATTTRFVYTDMWNSRSLTITSPQGETSLDCVRVPAPTP